MRKHGTLRTSHRLNSRQQLDRAIIAAECRGQHIFSRDLHISIDGHWRLEPQQFCEAQWPFRREIKEFRRDTLGMLYLSIPIQSMVSLRWSSPVSHSFQRVFAAPKHVQNPSSWHGWGRCPKQRFWQIFPISIALAALTLAAAEKSSKTMPPTSQCRDLGKCWLRCSRLYLLFHVFRPRKSKHIPSPCFLYNEATTISQVCAVCSPTNHLQTQRNQKKCMPNV